MNKHISNILIALLVTITGYIFALVSIQGFYNNISFNFRDYIEVAEADCNGDYYDYYCDLYDDNYIDPRIKREEEHMKRMSELTQIRIEQEIKIKEQEEYWKALEQYRQNKIEDETIPNNEITAEVFLKAIETDHDYIYQVISNNEKLIEKTLFTKEEYQKMYDEGLLLIKTLSACEELKNVEDNSISSLYDYCMVPYDDVISYSSMINIKLKEASQSIEDKDKSKYSVAINYLIDNNIVRGFEDGSFKPFNNITRAEFMKIAMGANSYFPEGSYCFPDVHDEWYSGYICKGVKNGFVSGNNDGNFYPNNEISVAEGLKILLNIDVDTRGKINVKFKSGKSWWDPYYEYALENNLFLGGFQYPDKKLTREEMAELIYRLDMNIEPNLKLELKYLQLVIDDIPKYLNEKRDNNGLDKLEEVNDSESKLFKIAFDWNVKMMSQNFFDLATPSGTEKLEENVKNSGLETSFSTLILSGENIDELRQGLDQEENIYLNEDYTSVCYSVIPSKDYKGYIVTLIFF